MSGRHYLEYQDGLTSGDIAHLENCARVNCDLMPSIHRRFEMLRDQLPVARARRERIATAVLGHLAGMLTQPELAKCFSRDAAYDAAVARLALASGAVALADALIAELDR